MLIAGVLFPKSLRICLSVNYAEDSNSLRDYGLIVRRFLEPINLKIFPVRFLIWKIGMGHENPTFLTLLT
jgi:hypothetical protein